VIAAGGLCIHDLTVLVGRSRCLALRSHWTELQRLSGGSIGETPRAGLATCPRCLVEPCWQLTWGPAVDEAHCQSQPSRYRNHSTKTLRAGDEPALSARREERTYQIRAQGGGSSDGGVPAGAAAFMTAT
jgi:hypothetical protein